MLQLLRDEFALRQGTVQVDITTVHEDMLTGCMSRFGGNQKYRHGRDFLSCGHSFTQRDLRNDSSQLFVTVLKSVEPLSVKGRHDFRRDNRVDADATGQ